MSTALERTLVATRELIADRARWQPRNVYAATADGRACSPRDDGAARWCLLGALMRSIGDALDTEPGRAHLDVCERALRAAMPEPMRAPAVPPAGVRVGPGGDSRPVWPLPGGGFTVEPPRPPDALVYLNDTHGHAAVLATLDTAIETARRNAPRRGR